MRANLGEKGNVKKS